MAGSGASSGEKLLVMLKTLGPMTAGKIAENLGVTAAAAHQQLAGLRADALVDYTKERSGKGRPAHLWCLTSKGHARFPDSHAEFAAGLLLAIRDLFGDEGLERLVADRAERQLERYRARIPERSEASLADRITELARIRREENYMAESVRRSGGGVELVESHCAIERAARICPSLCESELRLIQATLGDDVSVERIEHFRFKD
ncbi:MAG: MarR family transcriptional regulator [Gemmatimonadetes bacterium]|nr:MarR family transcriptional regulator [Gemmatimonadota bacterium]